MMDCIYEMPKMCIIREVSPHKFLFKLDKGPVGTITVNCNNYTFDIFYTETDRNEGNPIIPGSRADSLFNETCGEGV